VTVLTGLVPHLPEASREAILQDALSTAQEIEDEWYRAEALNGLIPHLPAALRETALREIMCATFEMRWEKTRAENLAKLMSQLMELSPSALLSFWQKLLRHLVQHSRQEFLEELPALTPIVVKLGRNEAIVELFRTIQDVGRWWP